MTKQPFVPDPTRDHREQYYQNPMDNLMYGVRDIDDLDESGNHHPDYEAYEAAQKRLAERSNVTFTSETDCPF